MRRWRYWTSVQSDPQLSIGVSDTVTFDHGMFNPAKSPSCGKTHLVDKDTTTKTPNPSVVTGVDPKRGQEDRAGSPPVEERDEFTRDTMRHVVPRKDSPLSVPVYGKDEYAEST